MHVQNKLIVYAVYIMMLSDNVLCIHHVEPHSLQEASKHMQKKKTQTHDEMTTNDNKQDTITSHINYDGIASAGADRKRRI